MLERIDSDKMSVPLRIVLGSEQCRPGYCNGLHTCSDYNCEGHPNNAIEDDGDSRALHWLVVAYIVFISLCLVAIYNAEKIYYWIGP